MKTLTTAFAAILIAGPALAQEFTAGGLTVGHPMAYQTAPSAMAGAGYMIITNHGDALDRLIGVRADFPRVTLHTSEKQDGVARMRPVESVEIAPGETVAFEPGGLHVMFMGLEGDPFEVGEQIPATLLFERAGEVAVTFAVEPRGADTSHVGHGGEAAQPTD